MGSIPFKPMCVCLSYKNKFLQLIIFSIFAHLFPVLSFKGSVVAKLNFYHTQSKLIHFTVQTFFTYLFLSVEGKACDISPCRRVPLELIIFGLRTL